MSLDPNATEVTVVANVDGTDCRFELALSELGVDEFEARLRELLAIPSEKKSKLRIKATIEGPDPMVEQREEDKTDIYAADDQARELLSSSNLCSRCMSGLALDDQEGKFAKWNDGTLCLDLTDAAGDSGSYPTTWHWADWLPDLPDLTTHAYETGCPFCRLLGAAIKRWELRFDHPMSVHIMLEYAMIPEDSWKAGLKVIFRALCARLEIVDGLGPGSNAIEKLTFTLEGERNSTSPVNSWLRLESPPEPDVLCDENVAVFQNGIEYCVHKCHPLPLEPFFPSRLIDLGSATDAIPRLITKDELDNTAFEKYIALSYCWGPPAEAKTQLKTETKTLPERMGGMPLNTLSAVMRDAVLVCRKFGFRYLWVDAVCIIQDDESDWAKEAAMMGRIYENTYLIICALGSSSCNEGFLDRKRRLDTVKIPFSSIINRQVRGSYTIWDTDIGSKFPEVDLLLPASMDMSHSSWSTRGWTYQEARLSRRLLIFSGSKAHLVCAERTCSEGNYSYKTSESQGLKGRVPIQETSLKGLALSRSALYGIWSRQTVNKYLERQFTKRSDALPALAGLAGIYAKAIGDEYAAGLWKNDILNADLGLYWVVKQPQGKNIPHTMRREAFIKRLLNSKSYIAPSWSWAACDQNCKYIGYPVAPIHSKYRRLKAEYTTMRVWTGLSSPNPFGGVSSGAIEVVGQVIRPPSDLFLPNTELEEVRQYFRTSGQDLYNMRWILADGRYFADCYLDWASTQFRERRGPMLMLLLGSYAGIEGDANEQVGSDSDYTSAPMYTKDDMTNQNYDGWSPSVSPKSWNNAQKVQEFLYGKEYSVPMSMVAPPWLEADAQAAFEASFWHSLETYTNWILSRAR